MEYLETLDWKMLFVVWLLAEVQADKRVRRPQSNLLLTSVFQNTCTAAFQMLHTQYFNFFFGYDIYHTFIASSSSTVLRFRERKVERQCVPPQTSFHSTSSSSLPYIAAMVSPAPPSPPPCWYGREAWYSQAKKR